MLLENIYNGFVENTGLTSGVYKSIFLKIDNILETIKDIKFLNLKYRLDDVEVSYNLCDKTVPAYVIDIINNLFEEFYMFPENSYVELSLTYKDINYKIIYNSNSEQLIIPDEIKFIKDVFLLEMFILNRPVIDVFSEFDRIFKFTSTFKIKISGVLPALQKRFQQEESEKMVIDGEVKKGSIVNNQALLEKYKEQVDLLSNKIEDITVKISAEEEKKNKISFSVQSLKGLHEEKKTLISELDIIRETYRNTEALINKYKGISEETDKILSDSANGNTPESDILYLKSKKSDATLKIDSLGQSLENTKTLLDITQSRLGVLDSDIKKFGEYTENDVDVINTKIKNLTKEKEDYYSTFVTFTNEIKNIKQSIVDEEDIINSVDSKTTEIISESEKSEIIDNIVSPQQPMSVTTVLNYLRYYFAFKVSQFTRKMETVNPDIDISILQAISCRIVLTSSFGLFFNNCFSIFEFSDGRHENISLLIKE